MTPSRNPNGPVLDPADLGRPIRCVQVRNYGCLRNTRATLGSFAVIVVGANAAGKTTLLDVIGFTADALQTDVSRALLDRATALEELLWYGQGHSFQIALEFSIPKDLVRNGHTDTRYELEVGREGKDREARVLSEGLFLKDASIPEDLIHTEKTPKGWRKVLGLNRGGTGFYRSERTDWKTVFQLGSRRLALAQVQDDQERFPVALWVKSVLLGGVQRLELNSKAMSRPASPLLVGKFLPDGSNLPIVVRRLKAEAPKRFREWVGHVSEALPDLKDVRVVEREEDKHAYLKLVYDGGLDLPAWRVSDGTLRLLALTLIAYIDLRDAVYLIEEPENGIRALNLAAARKPAKMSHQGGGSTLGRSEGSFREAKVMATITRAVALVLSLVLIPAGATADTVRLKTGGMIPQAQILSEEGDTVMLRTPGSRMGVPKSMIVRIEKETSVFDTYDKMRKNIKDSDGPGLFKLAQWCKDNGLREELHGTLSKLIEADPNHFVARHLLGHVRKGEGWEELPPLSIKVRMVGEKEFKEDVEQQLGIIFQTRRDFQLLEEDGTSESQGPTPVSFETKVTTGKMSEARFYKQFVRGATVWAEMALSVQGGFLGRTPTAISIQGEVASGLPSGEHLAVVDGFNRNHKKIHDFLDTIVEKRVASREPRRSEKADKTEKTGKGDKKKSEKKSEKKTDQKVEKPKTQSASTVL